MSMCRLALPSEHPLRPHLAHHVEAVALRHLHVEEDEVGTMLLHGFHGLVAVAAFGDQLDLGILGEEALQAGARSGFIVHDDGADVFHVRSVVGS
jgi:hypothetical protein